MKLGITLMLAGLAGTLLFLGAAVNIGNWDLYQATPWFLAAGGVCFIVFLIGNYRFRKAVRRRNEERDRRW